MLNMIHDASFLIDLSNIINKYSIDNASNTPDFILAEYLRNCLNAFTIASNKREEWYGVKLEPGHNYKNTQEKEV